MPGLRVTFSDGSVSTYPIEPTSTVTISTPTSGLRNLPDSVVVFGWERATAVELVAEMPAPELVEPEYVPLVVVNSYEWPLRDEDEPDEPMFGTLHGADALPGAVDALDEKFSSGGPPGVPADAASPSVAHPNRRLPDAGS